MEKEEGAASKKKCLKWRKRTSMERYLILTSIMLFILFLSMIGLVIYLKYSHKHPLICKSAPCYKEAVEILRKMNISANPCEDFHNFACGSFIKYAGAPGDIFSPYVMVNQYVMRMTKEELENDEDMDEPDFVRKVKLHYNSCLNQPIHIEEIIRQLLNLTKLNIWPLRLLKIGYIPTLEERLATATMLGVMNPYFTIASHLIGTQHTLMLFNTKMIIPINIFLNTSDEGSLKKKEKYKYLMASTLSAMEISLEDINLEIKELIEFETNLVKLFYKKEENTTEITTFSKLENSCPQFKWTKFWKHITDYYGRSNDYNAETPIRVWDMNFIKNICKLFENSDPRIVHDYLVWRLLLLFLLHFEAFLEKDILKIIPLQLPQLKSSIRWIDCIYRLKKSKMNPALEYLTIKQMSDEKLIQETNEYVKEIRMAMEDMFTSERWLDNFSKDIAKKKLQSIRVDIGYSNISINVDLLQNYFRQIEVSQSYIENVLLEKKHAYRKQLFNDTIEFPKLRILSNPEWPKAFYRDNEGINRIGITLGYLTSPYLVLEVPKYLKYGGIGVVIGHEFAHAFDRLDLDFEEYSWPNNTIKKFKEKEQCYIDQYSQFSIDDGRTRVDGFRTKRENIADNAGLFQAMAAYEKFLLQHGEEPKLPGLDFTNKQMFFIRFGQLECEINVNREKQDDDTHSPGKYRVIAPLQNLQQFSEAFNCPLGSRMNPTNKCRMWG